MRWGSTSSNATVWRPGPIPLSSSSRDEDINPGVLSTSLPLRGSSRRETTKRTVTPRSDQPIPPQKQQSRVLGSARRESLEKPKEKEQVEDPSQKFLVCAGKGVSGNGECQKSNNDPEQDELQSQLTTRGDLPTPRHLIQSIAVVHDDIPKLHSGLHRSDSELERIINELREQIVVQQREEARKAVQQHAEDVGGNSLSRKHLKNPIERMSMLTQLSSGSSSTTNLLRRQASTSHVHRLVSESSATMVMPAIISTSSSRGSLSTASQSNFHTTPPSSRMDSTDITISQAASSGDGFRIRSYTSSHGNVQHPPHFVSSTSLGRSTQAPETTTATMATAKNLQLPQRKPSYDTNLKLDVPNNTDNDEEGLEDKNGLSSDEGSCSPVGPWMLGHDYDLSLSTSSSLTTSRSTSSLSPLPSNVVSPPNEHMVQHEDMSPRSRLLWLSDCSFDEVGCSSTRQMLALLRPGDYGEGRWDNRPQSARTERRRRSDIGSRPKSSAPRLKLTGIPRSSASLRNQLSSNGTRPTTNARQPASLSSCANATKSTGVKVRRNMQQANQHRIETA